jgi:hypothetical protein
MKFLIPFLLVFEILTAQVWIQVPDFPGTKRDDGIAVVVNGKAYVGTGLQEWNATIDFFALDLSSSTWTVIPSMPHTTERQYACAFAGNNCFYVFGGDGIGGALTTMYKYDVTTATWTSVSSKPGNGLIGAACLPFGDNIIISGGKFSSGKKCDEVWEYRISTDSWTQKNNYPFAGRWRSGATVLNGTGYLLFGQDTGSAYRKELYSYSPSNDTWTKLSDFPMPRGRAYAALQPTNSKLCVFGGTDSLNTFYKDLWYFDPLTTMWLQGPDLPGIGRRGGMACAYEDLFVYTCGLGQGDVRLIETWITHIPVGISEITKQAVFSVFPIPSQTHIQLLLNSALENDPQLRVEISNLMGTKLLSFADLSQDTPLNISSLSKGVYLLNVFSAEEWLGVKKIIKD